MLVFIRRRRWWLRVWRPVHCGWWLALVLATAQADGLGENQADIGFESEVAELQVTISSPPGVCPAGQHEDIRVGGCTPPLPVATNSISRFCECSCKPGYSGQCAGRQTTVTTTYGWQLPPSGTVLISNVGEPVVRECKEAINTCQRTQTEEEQAPSVGDSFKITTAALICGASDSGYGSVQIEDVYKEQVIAHYRGLGISGRCPERSGFTYWLNEWRSGAALRAAQTYPGGELEPDWGRHLADGFDWFWDQHLRQAIDHSAEENDEAGAGGVAAADDHCQRSGNARYGIHKVSASYILQSGNRCRVNAVF